MEKSYEVWLFILVKLFKENQTPQAQKKTILRNSLFRLSKKSRKVWAFSSFYGIIILVMKDDGKGL